MVRISLAHMAVDFVGAAIDLLAAVEREHEQLPDEVIEAAQELRDVIERGGW